MTVLLAVVVGVLFGASTYLFLKRSVVKMILGIILLGYATNVLLFMMGDLNQRDLPILGLANGPMSDAVPQALILTAIVIGFGVLAFTLTLSYRFYFELRSEDLDTMNEEADLYG